MPASYADFVETSTDERYQPTEDDYYDMAIAEAEMALNRLRREDRQAILERLIKDHEESAMDSVVGCSNDVPF